jgi:predicted DNA-binding transcriptional regulator AlpA
MSGRRSRRKGARTERSIVNALQASGIAALRVPLSGAAGGRFAGDIVLPLIGRDLCVEVTARADGFRELCCWPRRARRADRQGRSAGAACCRATVLGCRNWQTGHVIMPRRPAQITQAELTPQGSCGDAGRMSVRALSPSQSRPVPRRGLSRSEAAIYLGVSTSKFDELVADGRMPRPRFIDSRKVWDVYELDMAFDDLPREHSPSITGSSWDDR